MLRLRRIIEVLCVLAQITFSISRFHFLWVIHSLGSSGLCRHSNSELGKFDLIAPLSALH